jgi:periplasmic copper chaperone A
MLSFRNGRGLRAALRTLLVTAGTAVGLVALAGTAFAHITITPTLATAGSTIELHFRVPNEDYDSSTIEVEVQVPPAHPLAQFHPVPVPGWTITTQSVKLAKPIVADGRSYSTAVSLVTWSGGKISHGNVLDFPVSVGPLPSGVNQLVFKAIQVYANGDIVRWIDLNQPGQPVPAHPAPILTVTSSSTAVTAASGQPAATAGGNDIAAITVSAVGLVAGMLGLAAGTTAWLRARQVRGS